MALTVTIDRTDLALADLVIGDHPSAGFWIPEDGLVYPEKRWSRTTAGSAFMHGTVQTSARLEHATLQLTVYVSAEGSTLAARRAEIEAAVFQWVYEVTVAEDGETTTYTADCGDVSWGSSDSGVTRAGMARAVLTIPCYPVGA